MSKFIDLTGKRFGRLCVIRFSHKVGRKSYWLCQCDCGNKKTIEGYVISHGVTCSCGCYGKEQRAKSKPKILTKNMRLYSVWANIKSRCFNKKNTRYKCYGKRGITVCSEWVDKKNGSKNFIEWASKNGYQDNLTIDRINVNGNYEPSNCRWVSKSEQAKNTTKNKILLYNGEKKIIADWAKEIKIKYATLYNRKRMGWSDKDIIETPIKTLERKNI